VAGRGREVSEVLRSQCRSLAWLTGRAAGRSFDLDPGVVAQSGEPALARQEGASADLMSIGEFTAAEPGDGGAV
jgi:hypothetical protein